MAVRRIRTRLRRVRLTVSIEAPFCTLANQEPFSRGMCLCSYLFSRSGAPGRQRERSAARKDRSRTAITSQAVVGSKGEKAIRAAALLVCRQMHTKTSQLCRRFVLSALLAGCFCISGGAGQAMASGLAAASGPWTLDSFRSKPPQIPPQPGVFPTIDADALDKTTLHLPSGMEGRLNLLLLSWTRNQVSALDSWTATAQALQHTRFDFRVYRMPISAPENALFRWWDNASLRAAETDPELLHWDVPLYTDKALLHQAIGTEGDERSVVILLVERSGRIVWKGQVASTEATRAGLLTAAAAIH